MVLSPFQQPKASSRKLPPLMFDLTTYENRSNTHNNDRLLPESPRVSHTFQVSDKLALDRTNEGIAIGCKSKLASSNNKVQLQNLSLKAQRQLEWCDEVRKLKSESPIANQKDYRPFGKFNRNSKEDGLLNRRRVVRFQIDEDSKECADRSSLDTCSTSTSSSASRKSHSTISTHDRSSSHKCTRTKTTISRSKLRRLYWSSHEVQQIRRDAHKSAKAFRNQYPATAKQVDRLFEDFCSSKNKPGNGATEDDEETEEILRDFLQDWAGSDFRGLEEEIATGNMFRQDRNMAVGSVLAYQESLRKQTGDGAAFADRIAEQLRARSESASHRSRMFSMYLALGDALVVAADF